jgi:hypothetical protein
MDANIIAKSCRPSPAGFMHDALPTVPQCHCALPTARQRR